MGRILVVDDSPEFLTYVTSIINKTNHSVVTVEDPRDALEKLQHDDFDMVLTDVNMPGGVSGFDLVKTIRKLQGPEKNAIPVVLLTGRKDKADVQKGLDFGADDYIVKPLDSQLFLSKIESLLKKSPGTRLHFAQGHVFMEAGWEAETRILHVTEKGMTLWSALLPLPDTTVKIKSPFFQSLGIEPPPLRVVACREDGTQPHRFIIWVNFIGLNDGELQKIRLWVNTHPSA